MASWTATASSNAANKIPDRAAGITSAAYTAGTEAAAAAVPTISPAQTSTRPLRRLVTVPAGHRAGHAGREQPAPRPPHRPAPGAAESPEPVHAVLIDCSSSGQPLPGQNDPPARSR